MSTSLIALILFALWGLLLVASVGIWRGAMLATGKMKAGTITSGAPHGPDAYWRLNRAHMNVMENLPVFAALVLVGVGRVANASEFDTLASVVIAARIVQSLIHISSGTAGAIRLRFAAYLVQWACFVWMGWRILQAGGVL